MRTTKIPLTVHTPVFQFVEDHPARAALLEELGIDYCCGGQTPFEEACRQKGMDPQKVFDRVVAFHAPESAGEQVAQSAVTATEWVNHIEKTHHVYLKAAMPRIMQLIEKVVAAHGHNHPELKDLEAVYTELVQDLGPHLIKEERVLFPMIRKMDGTQEAQTFHCGSIQNPIRIMLMEHNLAGDLLQKIKDITHSYTPPEDACRSYQLMLDELHRFALDTHLHVHKENNILFPMVLEQLEMVAE
ncbi:iron-sulfur cluster repair di-iron protein [Nitrospina gracilis]|uniref:iron-sulfur cluster repair di-iron protein n=1 Tax=Nitrospina gracilis TaxID=35801 RepID=UPI001F027AC4|nr:iron-sulfur cluster repair di-iron protein [Nitrospina gracilis]MCF8721172.1 regulator of cell morphogenesis and NO signaling [Nitrospina gracilis Nb-211]